MASFDTYDFDSDPNWKSYLNNVTLPPDGDEKKVMDRLKRKYYKRNIDPDFSDEAPSPTPTPQTSSNTSSSNTSNNTTSYNSSYNARPASSTPSSPPPPLPVPSFLSLQNIWKMSHFSVLISTFMYLIPFLSPDNSTSAYRRILISYMVGNASFLWQLFGAGYYTSSSAIRAKDNVYYLLYCASFLLVPPSVMIVVPLVIYSFYSILDQVYAPLTRIPFIGKYVIKAKANSQQAAFIAAYVEVIVVGVLFLMVLIGLAPLICLVVHWQFLNYRCNTSQPSAAIIEMLNQKIEGLMTHRWCPSVIQGLYLRARYFFTQYSNFDRHRM